MLEEYDLDGSIYEKYFETKSELNKIKLPSEHIIILIVNIILFYASCVSGIFLIGYFSDLVFSYGFKAYSHIDFTYAVYSLVSVCVIAVTWFINSNTGLNLITFGKHKKITEQKQALEKKIESIKKRVSGFEEALSQHHQDKIKRFYLENLYRKRSGTDVFEERLSEFSAMIDESNNINKLLITKYIHLKEYEDYLTSRKINHYYAKNSHQSTAKNRNDFINSINKARQEKTSTPETIYREPRVVDWDLVNAKRNSTGARGEEITVAIEQEYLNSVGRNDLAEKVENTSISKGDGLGYDVLSFFANGKHKYIEVKTTSVSIDSNFYLSRNELNFLSQHQNDAYIYRVQITDNDENLRLRVYEAGELLHRAQMTPIQYLVRLK